MTQLTGTNGSSRANTSGHAASLSQYSVHKGDTLSGIAARHGVTLGALERANPSIASQRFIFPGDKLVIPSGSQASAQNTASHTINRGETLSSIAAKHGTTVQAIADANPSTIKNVNHIYPGDTIVIPSVGRVPASVRNNEPAASPRTTQNQPATQIESRGASNTGIIQPGRTSLRAADIAEQRAAGRPSIGRCYAWVKDALLASGATSRRLDGVPAKAAGAELRSQGYVNVLGQPGYNIRSPYDAPKGAVLVYGAAPRATDNNAKYGHIEIRTQNGFASDFYNTRARTGLASNSLSSALGANKPRVLIGVYIKADLGAKPVQVQADIKPKASANSLPANQADAFQRVGNIIAHGEGGYESYNAGTLHNKVIVSRIKPPAGTVTNKTINEIIATQGLFATDPNRLFATGKYQTIIPTLKSAKAAMGLTGNERYTPAMQERVFREYLIGKAGGGKLQAFINQGKGSVETAQYAASKEWASIAVPAGLPINGYTDKNGNYHPGPISNGRMSFYESKANHANVESTDRLRAALQQYDTARDKAK